MHPFHQVVTKVLNLVLILGSTAINASSTTRTMIPSETSPSTAPPAPFGCSRSSNYYNCPQQEQLGGKGKKGGYSQQIILAETHMPTQHVALKTPTISPANHGKSSSSPSSSSSTRNKSSNTWSPTMQKNKKMTSSSIPSIHPSSTQNIPTWTESPSASLTSTPSLVKRQEHRNSDQPSLLSRQPLSNEPSVVVAVAVKETSPSLPPIPYNSTHQSLLESTGCYDPPLDIFGSISSHQTIIPFAYEIVYDPSFPLKVMLQSLETSIILAMLRAWPIPGCNNEGNPNTTESSDLMKETKVTGLSSRPYDIVSNKACTFSMVNTTTHTSCDSIDARFSIFYRNPNATDYITQLLAFIQKGMENDLFVGSHVGIIKVVFLKENLQRDSPAAPGRGRQEDPPSPPEVDNSMLPVFAWYLVASAGVAIVGVALRKWFVRRTALNYGDLGTEGKSEVEPVN